MLGGQACITGSRQTYAAATTAASTRALATQARVSGMRCGFRRSMGPVAGARSPVAASSGGGGSGKAGGTAGTGSATASITGAGSGGGTGAHWLLHLAHRTFRPGASGPGKSYSAAQDGQVISTRPICGTPAALATDVAA